jgi:hypothetical protein
MGLMAGHMVHRITVQRQGAPDREGNRTPQTWTNVPARAEPSNRLIRTANGEEKPSRAFLATEFAVQVGDLITVPGETKAQSVLDVRPVSGLGGAEDHREVYL